MSKERNSLFQFKNLRDLRERAGIARAKLAKEAQIDRGTLTRLEDGFLGRKENLIRICNALNRLFYKEQGATLALDEHVVPACSSPEESGNASVQGERAS